jgi:hypothetical protein
MIYATVNLLALAANVNGKSGNMNGKYSVSSGDKLDVPFPDDYASKGHEYFDVWSPEIATTYGENYWTDMGLNPIPDEIIKRFDGKVMAITGYEQDQVLVDPVGQPGVHPERDVSVPINWAYNHHYECWMVGKHATLSKVAPDPNDYSNHGGPNAPAKLIATPSANAPPGFPSSQWFSEGNGGESRKSFHGYPNGFAQLIHSPTQWHITPMQIDTRRRDCGVTAASIKNCTTFEPWLEPRQARYGRKPHGTSGPSSSAYSGVLECPCTSRYGGSPFYYPDAKTKVNGSLCEAGGVHCHNFTKRCTKGWDGNPSHEGGELITQSNPTCWSATYAGGLSCCGHKRILLDADQDPGPTLLRYHMKWRFWFQEYKNATEVVSTTSTSTASSPAATTLPSHYDLPRFYYQTEGWAGEYDIPPAFRRATDPVITGYEDLPISTPGNMHLTPGSTCMGSCPDGPDCTCEHKITYNWVMSNATMLYAGGHCHAPSCISIELWKNDTGKPELLCRQASKYGKGDVKGDKFDELGYIVLPPCLWGDKSEGLEPPVYLPTGTPMFSIKRNRNTYVGHTGEMASWQMRGVHGKAVGRPMA